MTDTDKPETTFTKLSGNLAASGIWKDPPSLLARHVWLTLLLEADSEGIVARDLAELAALVTEKGQAMVQPSEVATAIGELGSRVESLPGGRFRLPNHQQYRDIKRRAAASTEDRSDGST